MERIFTHLEKAGAQVLNSVAELPGSSEHRYSHCFVYLHSRGACGLDSCLLHLCAPALRTRPCGQTKEKRCMFVYGSLAWLHAWLSGSPNSPSSLMGIVFLWISMKMNELDKTESIPSLISHLLHNRSCVFRDTAKRTSWRYIFSGTAVTAIKT